MKKLSLLILLSFMAMTTNAQIIQQDSTLQKIELNLDKFHKQYRTGTVFTVVGTVISMVGIMALSQDSDTEPAILYCGGLILSVGGVIHLDSHKFLNRKRR